MRYDKFPGEDTYVVFRTEGTGEQGGSPIVEKELLASFGQKDDAISYGRARFPRVTGWEWENFTININTITEQGKEELKKFEAECALIEKDIIENPHLYTTYKMSNGMTITIKHNELFDGPRKQ